MKNLLIPVLFLVLAGSLQAQQPTLTPVGTSIVIEGPVQSINGNAITISNIAIQLDDDFDASRLQIGDIVRVEGSPTTTNNVLVIIAVTVVIVVDIDSGTPTPAATAIDTVTPSPDDDDDGIRIIIEGPVQSININIITIYDIDIIVAPDDPILTVIKIGDVIRIEGDRVEQGTTIVIIAVTVILVNVDVVINDNGSVWRDNDSCGNPPPSWAPANGWRRRCEGGNGNGNGNGRGRGKDDD